MTCRGISCANVRCVRPNQYGDRRLSRRTAGTFCIRDTVSERIIVKERKAGKQAGKRPESRWTLEKRNLPFAGRCHSVTEIEHPHMPG
ncbi:hypothetical protein Trydic_g20672 [Trypoxylus dichotomus]